MAKIDNRSLDHKVLEHMRLLAVERVLAGEKPSAVAKSFGLYRTSIYKWLRACRKHGREALKSTLAKGPAPKLTEGQRKQVRRWIVGKDPRQYGFDFGLWTRSIIAVMIQDKFEVSLTLPSIGRLLSSLDITPQKPLRRAYERDEKQIRQWKEEKCQRRRERDAKLTDRNGTVDICLGVPKRPEDFSTGLRFRSLWWCVAVRARRFDPSSGNSCPRW